MIQVIVGFTIVALIDFIPLLKKKQKNDIIAFLVMFSLAVTIWTLFALKVEIPSAMQALGDLLKSAGLTYPGK